MLKRSRQARHLTFGGFDGQQENDAAALSTMRAQSGWTSLRTLSFEAFQDKVDELELGADFAMLMWVLGKASALESLRLNFSSLLPLPSVCNLKHLQIMLYSSDNCDISSCLSTLHNLETLSLSFYSSEEVQRPHLCFRGLSRLHSLMLDDILPATLTLAEVTALLVRLYTLDDACEDIWASHTSQLRSFCLTAVADDIDAADKLPAFLLDSATSGLKSLTLIAKSFGCELHPICLHGRFLHVQRLRLQAIERMHLDIPGGLHPWHSIDILSRNELTIRMRSVPDFVASCRVFCFTYRNLQGLDLLRMCSYMTAQGMPWKHAAGLRCSHVHSAGLSPHENWDVCWHVWTMWLLLGRSQLTLDGLIPRTYQLMH